MPPGGGLRLPTEWMGIRSRAIRWGKRWEWTESAYLLILALKKLAGAIGKYNGSSW